jgi:hypothetical protein
MKKFAASLGIVALGTTALHAVEATALNPMQRSKPWSVAASLRGFYDDNINATQNKVDSFGFEISPSVDFGLAGDQTSFNLGYQLSARWYDEVQAGQTGHWDYTHIAEGHWAHTFSPRVKMSVHDSIVVGEEPDVTRAGTLPFSTPQLVPGDNVINYGAIDLNIEATDLLGFNVGYNNAYYHYADDNAFVDGSTFPPTVIPSSAGLLNRIENRANIDTQWKLRPQTMGIVGYMYGHNIYTADEPIGTDLAGNLIPSSAKDSRSHTFYVGAQHGFTPTLVGLIKVGAQYYDYYDDPQSDSQWSPYVLANLKYQFQTTTSMDVGFSYSRSAADIVGQGTGGEFVKDTEVALFYGNVSHEIFSRLIGTAKATVQHATYNGGGAAYDDQSYLFLQLGFDLGYQITPNFSAHAGYNYDDNDSDISGLSYNRNRVYVGVTAAY